MKKTRRNHLGQITGKEDMSYFFTSDIENESWTDHKVKAEDIRFPIQTIETYPVKKYHISELA